MSEKWTWFSSRSLNGDCSALRKSYAFRFWQLTNHLRKFWKKWKSYVDFYHFSLYFSYGTLDSHNVTIPYRWSLSSDILFELFLFLNLIWKCWIIIFFKARRVIMIDRNLLTYQICSWNWIADGQQMNMIGHSISDFLIPISIRGIFNRKRP